VSASHVVDLMHAVRAVPSIIQTQLSGTWPGSGAVVGAACDLLHANSFTNLLVVTGLTPSGRLRIAVQTSDSTTSGTFTDPTSGLPSDAFPTDFSSGGILWINSGGAGLFSGTVTGAGFLRPHRYARAIALSGDLFEGGFSASFVGQMKMTGISGFAGYSYSPTSGTPSV
jgi:hypothetical protein